MSTTGTGLLNTLASIRKIAGTMTTVDADEFDLLKKTVETQASDTARMLTLVVSLQANLDTMTQESKKDREHRDSVGVNAGGESGVAGGALGGATVGLGNEDSAATHNLDTAGEMGDGLGEYFHGGSRWGGTSRGRLGERLGLGFNRSGEGARKCCAKALQVNTPLV